MPNTINGTPRNDTISGTAGDDEIFGQQGRDTLSGGAGHDVLHAGEGDRDSTQNLYGEAGNDTLYGSESHEFLSGGTDNDILYGYGGNDTLYGDGGNDTLFAGDGEDVVQDFEGTNTIDMGAGDDYVAYVSYSNGVDTITGGAGSDEYELYGQIAGGAGHVADTITDFQAGLNGDRIRLANVVNNFTGWTDVVNPFTSGHLKLTMLDIDGDGQADDTALQIDRDGTAGAGAAVTVLNLLNVDAGDLTIDNFSRNGAYLGWNPAGGINLIDASIARVDGATRTINGSSDADQINGSWDNETLNGQEGNDVINAGGGTDNLNGGSGHDVVNAGSGNDSINEDAGDDVLNGESGNDTIYSYSGNDTLNGGDGDDTLYDSAGTNIFDGGAGDDSIDAFSSAVDTITGGSGSDNISVYLSRLTNVAGVSIDSITDFQTGVGGDVLNLRYTFIFQDLPANSNPFLSGHLRLTQSGADTILQGNRDGVGADWIDLIVLQHTTAANFGATNFQWESGRLLGPTGAGLTLTGGHEYTNLYGERDGDTITLGTGGGGAFGYEGDDVLNGSAGVDYLSGGTGNDNLSGGAGNDTLYGEQGQDALHGGDGDDYLDGGTEDDVITGGAGNDTLADYIGNNTLDGGDGDDTFVNVGFSSGVDTIALGAGRDTVALNQTVIVSATNAVDTVTDFTAGINGDRIDLNNVANYFQGWTNTTNPFATGHVRVVAGDIDGDGADDTLLQMDRNGGGDAWTTVLNLRDLDPATLTAQNFIYNGRLLDPFPGAASNTAPVQSSALEFFGIINQSFTSPSGMGWNRDIVDADGDTITASITTAPSAGVLSFNANGQVTFNASGVAAGTYAFTYTISDGTTSVLRNGSVTVLPNNSTGITVNGASANETISGFEGADTLNGGDGNDGLYGNGGIDTLNGGNGNDYFAGGAGDDILNGGDGDDQFANDAGADTITAGAGDDRVDDFTGANIVDLGDGNDTMWYVGYGADVDTITGGSGRDNYIAYLYLPTGAADIITDFAPGMGGDVITLQGLNTFTNINWGTDNPFATGHFRLVQSGPDTLFEIDRSGGGDSWTTVMRLQSVAASAITSDNFDPVDLSGHAPLIGWNPLGGSNTINGDDFRNFISGTNEVDIVNGDSVPASDTGSADTIRTYLGNDIVHAGAGDDTVEGGGGNDTLNGNDGNDTLSGQDGDDVLNGGGGDDSLAGGAGNDTLNGGSGNDRLDGGAGINILNGGDGDDDIYVGGDDETVDAGAGNDRINNISGDDNVDLIAGGADSDVFNISTFYPFIYGYDADTITDFTAGPNGDVLYLQSLTSYITGWDFNINPFLSGHMRLIARDADNDGAADDTSLQIDRDGTAAAYSFTTIIDLLNVAPGSLTRDNFQSDSLGAGQWYSPSGTGIALNGTDGDDNGSTYESLSGSFDADVINGLSGNDTINGLRGHDQLNGGGGADSLTGGEGNDILHGDDGSDTLSGSAGNDEVYGDAGNDTIYGDAGNDTLNGGTGDDYIYDYSGTNIIDGGAGADHIYYLSYLDGLDLVTGGSGLDRFSVDFSGWYYTLAQGHGTADRITDFEAGSAGDLLDLTGWYNGYFTGWTDLNTSPVAQNFIRFVQGDGDADGASDDVLVQADRDGAGATYGFVNGITLLNVDVDDLVATNVLFYGNRTWSLTGGNALPIALNDSYSTTEDTALTVPNGTQDVLNNDSDPEAQPITAVIATNPANGTVSLNADGSFVYTPNANFTGTDSFTYRANDGANSGNLATVTITVNPVNDAPIANPNSYSVNQDTTLTVADGAGDVLANDVDPDGNPLTASVVTGPAHGTLSLNANGSFTYTPAAGYSGSDSFTYVANDGTVNSAPASVTITVNATNVAPVGVADNYAVSEDGVLTVADGATDILANDTDANGDAISASLVTGPSNGVLSLNANGSFVYTPNANFSGTDTFVYRPTDGALNGNTTAVIITVNGVNDAPVADGDGPYAATEDTTLTITAANGVLNGDTDLDFDPLAAVLVTGTANGALVLNPNGSFSYTPDANFSGTDSFVYRASDGVLTSSDITVQINVAPENDAPVSANDSYTIAEDGVLSVPDGGTDILANDMDADGNPITATLVTGPANGTLAVNANGSFIYTPNANFNGSDSFTYRANDGTADGNLATVNITVTPSADVPVADADGPYAATEDTPLIVNAADGVLAGDTDVDGDALEAVLVTGTLRGALTLNADGSFVYTPDANLSGPDSFTYRAFDGVLFSAPRTVTINVADVNDAPVANNDSYAVNEDGLLTAPTALNGVLANDTDIEGNALTATLLSTTANGALTLNANGTFTYAPDANFNGTDSFTYRANDGSANSNVATVTITVNGVNDAPVAVDDNGLNAAFNTTLIIPVTSLLANDTDVDSGSVLSITAVGSPSNGTVILNGGTIEFTPVAGYSGPASFAYTLSDGTLTDTGLVNITVAPSGNTPPTAVNDSYTVNEDGTLNGTSVVGNDTDANGDPLTPALVSGPAHGALTLNADGTFTYTPTANFNGSDSFTYRVNDGTADSNIATVNITVNAVNDAPVAANDSYAVDEDNTLTLALPDSVLGNDSDGDGDGLNAAVVTGPAHGALTLNADGTFTYTPTANFNGSDSFTYRVNDGTADSNIATVNITVNAVNDAPVAANDSGLNVAFNTTLIIPIASLIANDDDGDPELNQALSISAVSNVLNGTAVINGGTIEFTPAAGYSGPASFDYTLSDGTLTDTGSVSLTVAAAGNVAPVANHDSYSVDEDSTLNVPALTGLLANDTDANGDPLTIVVDSLAVNGTLTVQADGSFAYTPNANFYGVETITYHVNDGTADSAPATLTITVNAINDAPTAGNGNYTVAEDIAITGAFLPGAADLDGDAVSYSLVSNAAQGSVQVFSNGVFNYIPAANYNGPDSFQFSVSDGNGGSNTYTAFINVTPVNDDPDAANDGTFAMAHNTALTIASATLLANDDDGDPEISQTLTILSVQDAANGTVSLNGSDVIFTPTSGYAGVASFSYTISDGAGGTDTATVRLSVGAAPSGGATEGDDTLYGTPNADSIDALGGNDRVFGRASGDIIHGGTGNDQLYGEGGDDYLHGDDGNDVLRGAEGNDYLYGNAGNDQLDGGEGNDRLAGGEGNDLYIINTTGDVVIEAADQGTDTIRSTVSTGMATNIEILQLLGTAAINGTGNALDNIMTGNSGNNSLSGRDGNDIITGGDGNDILNGGNGNDVMNGGNGTDTVSYKDATGAITLSLALTGNQITGGSGTDRVTLIENLEGSAFDDMLTGDSGANKLLGLAGADRLTGGAGDDDMTGGADADVFVFAAAATNGTDTIRDFATGVDVLEFNGADYGLAAGSLDPGLLAMGSANAATGQFVLGTYGALIWDADGTGAGAGVTIARLGSATVSASDFIIV